MNALAVLAWSDNDKEATVIGFLAGKKKITQQQKYHGSKVAIKNVGIKNYDKCIITNDEPNQIY